MPLLKEDEQEKHVIGLVIVVIVPNTCGTLILLGMRMMIAIKTCSSDVICLCKELPESPSSRSMLLGRRTRPRHPEAVVISAPP